MLWRAKGQRDAGIADQAEVSRAAIAELDSIVVRVSSKVSMLHQAPAREGGLPPATNKRSSLPSMAKAEGV